METGLTKWQVTINAEVPPCGQKTPEMLRFYNVTGLFGLC